MHEAEKLQEAEYFYSQVIEPAQNSGVIYNLRALLGSARSVLVYAHREVKNDPAAKAWYDSAVQDPVIRFLRNVRHGDVHVQPVGTNQTVHVLPAIVTVGVGGRHSGSVQHWGRPLTTSHHFAGWPGQEDVRSLCRMYLDRLKTFIEDGQRLGHLTR